MRIRFEFLLLGALLLVSAPAWGDKIDSHKISSWGTSQEFVAPSDSFNLGHASLFTPSDEHRDWSRSHDWRAWWADNDRNGDPVPGNSQGDPAPVSTPEPATVWMLAAGLIGMLGAARFRSRMKRL